MTTKQYRPVLGYFPGLAIGLGLLVTFSLSALMPWRYAVATCGLSPSAVQVAGTLLLPNSPRSVPQTGRHCHPASSAKVVHGAFVGLLSS